MSRQVVLDTETTGLLREQGHRIVEIGCVELVNRRLTGQRRQYYLNPERDIDSGAQDVHGLSKEFLADKPVFAQIEAELMEFLAGAELVIHNADFDVGFIDYELSLTDSPNKSLTDSCTVLDSLALANERHPGQSNNLNALCKRYGVDNTQRELHGALLDAEILAEVYLLLTSGQSSLSLSAERKTARRARPRAPTAAEGRAPLPLITASPEELAAHHSRLQTIAAEAAKNKSECLWLKLDGIEPEEAQTENAETEEA